MAILLYDSAVIYDTPDYTYDGFQAVFATLTVKEALFRELRYGETLAALMDRANVRLDDRSLAPSTREGYPVVLFNRVTSSEDDQVRYARERIEIELVGSLTSATAGDDLLQEMQEALMDAFAGQVRTVGQFDTDGSENPSTGLRLRCHHVNTVEMIDDELSEKVHILIFIFTYVREVPDS